MDRKNRKAAVFEIRRAPTRNKMETAAGEALGQIEANGYGSDLEGYREILCYGIAFFRKDALMVIQHS